MGRQIDLLVNYPKTNRNVREREAAKTEEGRALARQFGKEFFDGDRRHGYGGFNYHPRFWQPVVPTFQSTYGLTKESSVLDVGCAKGFMLYDFSQHIPGIKLQGIDVSSYAIQNAIEPMKPFVRVADARKLPYPDKSFDLVISINTIHNLELSEAKIALREMQRVSKKNSFLVVDAYRTEKEKELLYAWNLTAKTILHVEDWIKLFKEVGYTGDYYWFMP